MPRVLRGVLGALAAAAMVALLQPLPPGVAAPTKDFPLCIQGCNDARDLCKDQCKLDCKALFPDDEASKEACVNACTDICDQQDNDCKVDCQSLKNGESPPEP